MMKQAEQRVLVCTSTNMLTREGHVELDAITQRAVDEGGTNPGQAQEMPGRSQGPRRDYKDLRAQK